MKVLLTGASGYLGRHVLRALRAQGLEVVLLGRQVPPEGTGLPWIEADLLAPGGLGPRLLEAQATHLLHLAWYVEHGLYWTSDLNLRWADASLRLLQAFGEAGGQRAVLAGTCAEYDWAQGYCVEEVTPCHPATLYGVAKHATHQMAQAWCALHGVSLAWGRLFFTYGAGEHPNRLIPSLIEVFQGRRSPFGVHAEAYRGFLPVAEAASAFVALLASQAEGSFNVCSGQPVQLKQLVQVLAQVAGADPGPVLGLSQVRPHEPRLLVGSVERLRAVTGWQPVLSLEQGLRQIVAPDLA